MKQLFMQLAVAASCSTFCADTEWSCHFIYISQLDVKLHLSQSLIFFLSIVFSLFILFHMRLDFHWCRSDVEWNSSPGGKKGWGQVSRQVFLLAFWHLAPGHVWATCSFFLFYFIFCGYATSMAISKLVSKWPMQWWGSFQGSPSLPVASCSTGVLVGDFFCVCDPLNVSVTNSCSLSLPLTLFSLSDALLGSLLFWCFSFLLIYFEEYFQ